MHNLFQFLYASGCEKNLADLIGHNLVEAVIRIRAAIEAGGEARHAGGRNASGEKQLALDVEANNIVLESLQSSGRVSHLASEEMEELVEFTPAGADKFAVVFDPLDGSSLVDVNFAVGSIFGIYSSGSPVGKTGRAQKAACFAVFGPRTTIILTIKKGVHEFTLGSDGVFYLSRENLTIAPESKYFAPGNLRAAGELEEYRTLLNDWVTRGLTLRYSGGMVPDMNHIFLKGSGIFTYPGYSKAPEGKLRLLFECNPMALLAEQAGAIALDGLEPILDKKIESLHQRTPIFVGSKDEVKNVLAVIASSSR